MQDEVADGGPTMVNLSQKENLYVTGVFLVNLSYIAIWYFSFAYYRASSLLRIEKKYKT
jgi:hypothetical protein